MFHAQTMIKSPRSMVKFSNILQPLSDHRSKMLKNHCTGWLLPIWARTIPNRLGRFSTPFNPFPLFNISRKTQCLAPKVNRSNTKPGFRVFFGGVLYCSIPTHNRQVTLSSPGSVLVHRLGLLLTAMRHFRPHLPHILQDLSEFR